jgi:hypothetical protein
MSNICGCEIRILSQTWRVSRLRLTNNHRRFFRQLLHPDIVRSGINTAQSGVDPMASQYDPVNKTPTLLQRNIIAILVLGKPQFVVTHTLTASGFKIIKKKIAAKMSYVAMPVLVSDQCLTACRICAAESGRITTIRGVGVLGKKPRPSFLESAVYLFQSSSMSIDR